MKLIAAIALFVLSLSLAVVGVAERTIWAPAPTKTLSVEFDSGYPYVVIPGDPSHIRGESNDSGFRTQKGIYRHRTRIGHPRLARAHFQLGTFGRDEIEKDHSRGEVELR